MEEKMVIELSLTKKEAEQIIEFIGEQGLDDTKHMIERLGLDLDCEETDNAIYSLYSQLEDAMESKQQSNKEG